MTRERKIRCAVSIAALGLLIALAPFLGGCERVVYVDRPTLVAPTVAPSLLHCMPEPAPLPERARQRDVAPYVLDVLAAGQDCRRKLGTVRMQLATPAPAAAAPPEPTP